MAAKKSIRALSPGTKTTADKLRNNLDAAEYTHVVLGLVFLKYLSDASEELRARLESVVDEGADPEDPKANCAERVFWAPKEVGWPFTLANGKQAGSARSSATR